MITLLSLLNKKQTNADKKKIDRANVESLDQII
jgi:hypothetical protein